MTSTEVQIVELTSGHCDALLRFFQSLPEGDLTFIREDVTDPDTVRSWTSTEADRRWLALTGPDAEPEVAGYVAVRRLPGWSDHVGEIRLVVAPSHRGTGLGKALAQHALTRSIEAGMTKLVVEIVADQGAALALFTDLGFGGEALLENHIRDRNGELRDLLVLAHHVGDTWSGMQALGLAESLDGGGA